jgi:DNA-binding NtrC family response regulator
LEKPAILVIDDDESITATVRAYLAAKGYPVTAVNDGAEALELAQSGAFPIIISDIYIDRVTGLDILKAARGASVILMTARGSVRTTVEAEMGGAFEYLAKPFEMKTLLETVEHAERSRREMPPETAEPVEQFGNLVGFAPAMVEVYKRIARFARADDTVLITGETGVGKELVARAIHEHSARAGRPFVAVDSGAIAGTLWESEIFGSVRGAFTGAERNRPGMVETARGGTLFFDEIGEIPFEFQSKLLRFLQEKEYRPVGAPAPQKADVRIIAATNRPLAHMVREGKFREDLYYRLNVLSVDVPPLRDRRSDIPFLVRRFLGGQERIWLTREAEAFLEQHPWPGNVRQLENAMRRLIAMSPPGPVSRQDVERVLAAPQPDEDEPTELDERERRQILRVLEQTGGNKTRAAELLGIQRRTLYKKLARMGIDV